MNGAGKRETIDCVHGAKDRAVSALTQLMTLYLDKNSFEIQHLAEGSGYNVCSRETDEIMTVARNFPADTLGFLENPAPGALKNGMRAIGSALYEKTRSTEALNDVLYRVMEKFPNRDQEVIRVLDHAFDGIGGWWA